MTHIGDILVPDCLYLRRYADGVLNGLEGWQAFNVAFGSRSKARGMAGHNLAKDRADVKLYMAFMRQLARKPGKLPHWTAWMFLREIIRRAADATEANDPQRKKASDVAALRRLLADTSEKDRDIPMDALKLGVQIARAICPIPLDKFVE